MESLKHDSESTDLSALAWVNDELKRSLESAHKSLRRFLRESEAISGSDVGAVDPGVLRSAKVQIHQGVGALEMLGMAPAAALLRASEAALAQCINKPEKLDAQAVDCIEHASFALMDYLARLLANKPVSPLSLFPQYQAVQGLAGADRIHPADLWGVDWAWHDLPLETGVQPCQPGTATRSALECHMLAIMRAPTERNFERMSELCAGLAAGAPDRKAATLWQLASAVFEAQGKGLLQSDLYSKRLSARLLSQLRVLEDGGADVSERLAQDLLFFCSNAAKHANGEAAPRLAVAQAAWGLKPVSVDYHQPTLGRFDPALLTQANKRVSAAKDAWSAVAGGDLHRLVGLEEQFALMGDSLRKLYLHGELLADELQTVAGQVSHVPDPALAMEVATALLYIEASLEDGEVDTPKQGEHVRLLTERISSVRLGTPSAPLEPWMEELYRRVSDRQTMGSVVQELRASLSEAEKLADQFARQASGVDGLIPVPGILVSMRGVLSVLGLDQASAAVARMRDDVAELISGANQPVGSSTQSAILERLASNLGAMDFLIGMLAVQPQMARLLFVFDDKTGILSPVMGRELPQIGPTSHDTETLPTVEPRLIEQAKLLADSAASEDVPVEELSRDLEKLYQEARAAEQLNLGATVSQARASLEMPSEEGLSVSEVREQLSEALEEFVNKTGDGAKLVLDDGLKLDFQPVPTTEDLTEDAEMSEIFLEEAKDVIVDARAALASLPDALDDINLLTTIRRAFHTLKGSSRMVGLVVFGEAAWVCEQIYNGRLGDHKPADEPLLNFTDWVLQHFSEWVQDIENRSDGQRTPAPVVAAARIFEVPHASLDVLLGETQSPPDSLAPQTAAPEFVSLGGEDLVSLDFDSNPSDDLPALGESGGEAGLPAAMFPDAATQETQLTNGVSGELGTSLVEPNQSATAAFADEEDGLKLIGDLEIGRRIFGIFLNETNEASRRLHAELEAWSRQIDCPVSDNAVALAHALAGPSATIGFTGLSDLARALERALMRSQSARSGTQDECDLFLDVSREISKLLQLIAEGVLQAPDPQLFIRLDEHMAACGGRMGSLDDDSVAQDDLVVAAELPDDTGLGVLEESLEVPTEVAQAGAVAVSEESQEPASEAALLERAGATGSEHSVLNPEEQPSLSPPMTTMDLPALVDLQPLESFEFPQHIEGLAVPFDDDSDEFSALEEDLDAVDDVDAELFPIFEEEGLELLPRLAAEIRNWTREPWVVTHGTACMRTLHTIKGGARLAGAMRLGEMAHKLETRIEALLGQPKADSGELETLAAHSDALMHNFERMRSVDQISLGQAGSDEGEAAVSGEPVHGHSALEVGSGMPDELPSAIAELSEVSLPHAPVEVSSEAPAQAVSPLVVDVGPVVPEEVVRNVATIDWSHLVSASSATPLTGTPQSGAMQTGAAVRVRAPLLDRLVNQAGEVSISRSRMAADVDHLRGSLSDLTENLARLRQHLRDIELQGETQMASRIEAAKAADQSFDPLEFDRFTRFQELTRMMAESVNDVATVQRNLNRVLNNTEDELAAQGRMTRELQDDLLSTRMVEFDSLATRLHRVVRQAAKETGKQVRLDVSGSSIEVDRGVLERVTGAFEHLLRNSVVHGCELPEVRRAAGKDPTGTIAVVVTQEGNEVSVAVQDDGSGLDLVRIRQQGLRMGLIEPDRNYSDAELANLIFTAGFSTAEQVTEMAGRGIGMDVVRADVQGIGGRIEIATSAGKGTSFKLLLPLTTAVTQIVMMRMGDRSVAVSSSMVELICRVRVDELNSAYSSGQYRFGDRKLPFFWLGSLLQQSPCSSEVAGKIRYVAIIKSAQQRIAVHVDEVVGNQEAVVKNLGPQLALLPGLTGMTLLASGAVVLIWNPVALAALYGESARAATRAALYDSPSSNSQTVDAQEPVESPQVAAPLILVVDDSLTVRRVTQRLLVREGYRVALAKDGLDALTRLAEEKPQVVLSDIEMPRMDGFDLVRNIRGDERLKDLPVIMITSRIAKKHRDYAAELGVDHYLGKPYSEVDLLALISSYVATGAVAQ